MPERRTVLSRFDHVTVAVPVLSTAIAAYTRLLGRPPVWCGSHHELGRESALFGLENGLIELTAPRLDREESEGLRAHLAQHGASLLALSFGCDDARACHAALRERGVRVTSPTADEATGDDGTVRGYVALELSPRTSRGIPITLVERSDTEALRDAASFSPAQANALDHVVLRSADLDAARALYEGSLALRCALDTEVGGVRMVFMRIGGVTLELVADASLGAEDRFFGVAYRVRDLTASHTRLTGEGASVSEIRAGKKPGTRVFTVRDPALGTATLLVEDPARS